MSAVQSDPLASIYEEACRAIGTWCQEAEGSAQALLQEARQVRLRAVEDADRLLAGARGEADRVVTEARDEADRVVTEARGEADRLLAECGEEAGRLLALAENKAGEIRAQAQLEVASRPSEVHELRVQVEALVISLSGVLGAVEEILASTARLADPSRPPGTAGPLAGPSTPVPIGAT